MANHKDAAKRAGQSVRRRARNRSFRTRMRNQIQTLRDSLSAPAGKAPDAETIQAEFRQAVSVIQHLASKGVIHRNQAARRVARLAAAVKAKTAT